MEQEGITVSGRNSAERWAQFIVEVVVFAVGIGLGLHYLSHEFSNRYSVEGDVAQHTYWMASYHDPDLFKNDFYATYARSLTTPGLEVIYWVGTVFASPVQVGKVLSVFLFGLTGWLYFRVGKSVYSNSTGYLMAFLWLAVPSHISELDGGLHRAFMHPLMAIFVWALCARKLAWIPWILAAGVFIYPLSALIIVFALAFFLLLEPGTARELVKEKRVRAGWAAFAVCGITVFVTHRLHQPTFLGAMLTGQEMSEDPRFMTGGRSPYFPFEEMWFSLLVHAFNLNPWMMRFAWFALLIIPLRFIQGKNVLRDLAPFIALGVASIALFELAKVFHFHLYIPGRYLQYSPVVFGAGLIAVAAAAAMPLLRWKPLQFAATVAICAFIWSDARGAYDFYFKKVHYDVASAAGILKYLRGHTPKDTMIAADPRLSDAISIFSQRPTMLKYELSHPWYKAYRAETERRARDFYALLYSDSITQVKAIRDKYGLQYFVFDPVQFKNATRSRERMFYQPLNTELLYRYPVDDSKEYLMERIAAKTRGFKWERYEVISLDDKTLDAVGENPS